MARVLEEVLTWSELTVAVFAALGALWVGMKKLYRIAKNLEDLVESTGKNTAAISRIEAQLVTNGGSSLRDVVNRIDSRVTLLEHIKPTLTVNAVDGEQ